MNLLILHFEYSKLSVNPKQIDALPDVVQAVGGKCEVYVDSGIRRGSDVFKALALGADMVFTYIIGWQF